MDYYIRSWDPDSTYPSNPQEGDVCYTEVILYKGKAYGYCNEQNISVSGDIVDYGGEFVISGDGSITIGTN